MTLHDLLNSAAAGAAGAGVAFLMLALWGRARRSALLCRWRHRWLGETDGWRRCTRPGCGRVEILADGEWIRYEEYLKGGAPDEAIR